VALPPSNPPTEYSDDEGRVICGQIAKRLRELADKLDAACLPEAGASDRAS
jgi:hypothetical protein